MMNMSGPGGGAQPGVPHRSKPEDAAMHITVSVFFFASMITWRNPAGIFGKIMSFPFQDTATKQE
jgi:hypothetical protein